MNNEIYWKKALKQSEISIKKNSLFPLKTIDITKDIYNSTDFIIRSLDISIFNQKKIFGPKPNPFKPWELDLEIDNIGDKHQLILNKYPVQKGHILLITNDWRPQNGWLEKDDWLAIKKVNMDTSGLWFFNSCKEAGASQPHRHIQLLRRDPKEEICPRDRWFMNLINKKNLNNKLSQNIIVKKIEIKKDSDNLYDIYLELCNKIGLGNPKTNIKPKKAHNIIITNKWMAIIKRSKDNIHGFSVNSLGFAGYLLVTNLSDKSYLEKYGPEKLLESFV